MLDTAPNLSISPEKLSFIIAKAREFDVKDVVTDPDDSSNPTDDAMLAVLEDHPDDAVLQELTSFIGCLTEDEQIDLVALTWLGRSDATIDEWDEIRGEASRAHNKRTASYLLGMPLLSNHLEDGLSQFGISCDDDA
ncbi:MAG TPA: DUF3775 domain-containing protein [Xanthobacteraceae bacterium]|jgi:hypothetical protein